MGHFNRIDRPVHVHDPHGSASSPEHDRHEPAPAHRPGGAGQEVGAVNELLKRFKDMKKMMKQLGKMGLGSGLGAKGKREALAGLSPSGEMVDPKAGKRGMLGGLGSGLGGLFGGGGAGGQGGLPAGMDGLPPGFDPTAPRPMGSSATRKGGKSADARKKEKAKAKARRKNRKKR